MTPIKVSDADMAFGGASGVIDTMLPDYETLPEDFQRQRGPYCQLVADWFYKGITRDVVKVKDGIDEEEAWRHMKTCLGSFKPKHEHKMAGVAYLMSQWFDLEEDTQ